MLARAPFPAPPAYCRPTSTTGANCNPRQVAAVAYTSNYLRRRTASTRRLPEHTLTYHAYSRESYAQCTISRALPLSSE